MGIPSTALELLPTDLASTGSHVWRTMIKEAAGAEHVMRHTSTPQVNFRTRAEVHELLAGTEVVDFGVVPSASWRPDRPVTPEDAERSNAYAGVGIM